MKVQKIWIRRFNFLLVLGALAVGFAGCKTPNSDDVMEGPSTGDNAILPRLIVGDTVTVTFAGIDDLPMPQEKPIKDDGTITLPDVGGIPAAGKTAGELEDAIHAAYVPKIYTHLNVTVKVTSQRSYFVRGEIRNPSQLQYYGPTTVTKAITSAGDFTDFANRKSVWLIRTNGKRFKLNVNKILDGEAPDPPVFPGDQIVVQRRMF